MLAHSGFQRMDKVVMRQVMLQADEDRVRETP